MRRSVKQSLLACVSILAMAANPAQATNDISGSGSLTAPLTNNIVGGSVYSGVMSGTGDVTVTASNGNYYAWELTGINTFNGKLDIQTGANVELYGASSDLTVASVLVESGGQLWSLSNQTITDLSGAGTVYIKSGTTLVDQIVNGSTFSGNINGYNGAANNLAVIGNGTLTLSGINSYSGTTTVGSGSTLSISSILNIMDTSSVVLSGGGTLLVTGNNQTFTNAITLGAAGGTLAVANGMTDTFSGNISGTNGLNINTGTTTGTVILSGTNTSFSGNIDVQSGTLAVGNGTNLGTGIVYLNSNTALQINGTGTVANTIWGNGGGTAGEGTLGINAGGVTLSGAIGNSTNYLKDLNINNTGTTTASGVIDVATINFAANGTLALTNSTGGSSITTATTDTTGTGTLTVSNQSATANSFGTIGTSSELLAAINVVGGGIMNVSGNIFANAITISNASKLAASGNVTSLTTTFTDSSSWLYLQGNNTTLSGNVVTSGAGCGSGCGNIATFGTNVLLSGQLGSSTTDRLVGLYLESAGTTTASNVVNASVIQFNNSSATLALSDATGGSNISQVQIGTTNTGTLNLSNTGGTNTFGSIGTSSKVLNALNVTGSGGTTDVTGNMYVTNTTISNGATLETGGTISGAVEIDTGGILSVTGTGQTYASNITLGTGGGTINSASGTSNTFSGVISGNALTVNNGTSGTVILSGSNSFSGVAVDGGTLSFSSAANLSGTVTLAGGTLLSTDSTSSTLTNNIVLSTGGGTINMTTGDHDAFAGTITGTTGLTINNGTGGLVILNGSENFTGGLTIDGGKLYMEGTSTDYGTTTVNLGATLLIDSAANNISSETIIVNGGSIWLSSLTSLANNITLSGSGTIYNMYNNAEVLSGNITDGGSSGGLVVEAGTGSVQLTGANTYSGGTTIVTGTLIIGGSSNIGSGNVTMESGTTMKITGSGIFTNNVVASGGGTSGYGTVDITGSGVTLSGSLGDGTNSLANLNIDNTGTTVVTGNMHVNNTTLSGGATLSIAGNVWGAIDGDADGDGALVANGTSTVTGAIGGLHKLASLTVNTNDSLTTTSDVSATAITIKDTGTMTVGGVLTSSTVAFTGAGAGTLSLTDATTGSNIGTITTSKNGVDTLNVTSSNGGTSSFGSIGSNGHSLASVNLNDASVSITNDLYANAMTFSGYASNLTTSGNVISQTITFTSNGGSIIMNGNDTTLAGNLVSTSTGTAYGAVIISGTGITISGQLGTSPTHMTNDILIDNAGTTTATNTVNIIGLAFLDNGTFKMSDPTGGSYIEELYTTANNSGTLIINNTSGVNTFGTLGISKSLLSLQIAGSGGTTDVTGPMYVDDTEVGSGATLNSFGNIIGNMNIASGGVWGIGATGKTLTGALVNKGTLNLGTNSLTVVGNITGANSAIATTIGASSAGDIINTSNTANATFTGTLNVTPTIANGVHLANGDKIILVSENAGEALVATPTSTTIADGFRWTVSTGQTGTDIYGNLIIAQDVVLTASGATSGGNLPIVNPVPKPAINNIIIYDGNNSNVTNIQNAVQNLVTSADLNKAGAQLAPQANDARRTATFDTVNAALDTLAARNDMLRSVNMGERGLSSGEALEGYGVWTQGFGSFINEGARDGVNGYNSATGGAAFGGDVRVLEDMRIGASFAYADTSVDQTGDLEGSSMKIKSYIGSLYGTYTGTPWYIDGNLTFGYHNYNNTRLVNFTGAPTQAANGSFAGQQYGAGTEVGYPLDIAGAIVTPYASLNYNYLTMGSYTESGAPGADLTVSGKSTSSLRSGLGAKVSTLAASTDEWKFMPNAHVTWMHEFYANAPSLTSSFAGGSAFSTPGLRLAQDAGVVGVGLDVKSDDGLTLSAKYDFETRDQYTGNSFMLQLRQEF